MRERKGERKKGVYMCEREREGGGGRYRFSTESSTYLPIIRYFMCKECPKMSDFT